jgi:3-oxoisoapionate kinase
LLAYYGDDFTGSTDVLESLARSGIETVLFVEPATPEQLAAYPNARAVGVAGTSRTMAPMDMDDALPKVFAALGRLQPRFVHYKVCSTFDSSPTIGSIGRAIDIGARVFENRFVPLVVGAPVLQRFCVFGNLFARSGLDSPAYRLDRHPTMRYHPVTPMTEADLRVHLSQQTDRPLELVDLVVLDAGFGAANDVLRQLTPEGGRIVLFDVATNQHLELVGRLIANVQEIERKPLFVAGSSGVEYALVRHWSATAQAQDATTNAVAPVSHALIMSGSCSPVTERQIAWAVARGFVELPLGVASGAKIAAALESRRSVVVHSLGDTFANGRQAGQALGAMLKEVVAKCRVPRIAVAGGDTSGQIARAVGIESLEYLGPLEPGAPLCRARSREPATDGLEITFKGGQVGHDDFFVTLLRGLRQE